MKLSNVLFLATGLVAGTAVSVDKAHSVDDEERHQYNLGRNLALGWVIRITDEGRSRVLTQARSSTMAMRLSISGVLCRY